LLPHRVKDVVAFGKSIVTAMTGNPNFPSPNPPLATFDADLEALDASETSVLARTKGAAQSRNVKLATVHADFKAEQAYVQQVASANPANSAAIIQSAGMHVRTLTLHQKGELTAKIGKVSGIAELRAKSAGPRAGYEWQVSTDQKTWTLLPVTLQANTVVPALASGTTYYFRFRPVTKAGEGNWSQIVSLLVS
jgi:hypothetical protein